MTVPMPPSDHTSKYDERFRFRCPHCGLFDMVHQVDGSNAWWCARPGCEMVGWVLGGWVLGANYPHDAPADSFERGSEAPLSDKWTQPTPAPAPPALASRDENVDQRPANWFSVDYETGRAIAEAAATGDVHYGIDNWRKGLLVSGLLNHAFEHLYRLVDGDITEQHLEHVIWNLGKIRWMAKHRPELVDVPMIRKYFGLPQPLTCVKCGKDCTADPIWRGMDCLCRACATEVQAGSTNHFQTLMERMDTERGKVK